MFKQIVIIEHTGLQNWAIEKLSRYSENKIVIFDNSPKSEEETLKRIENADCVFVSWNTKLTSSILSNTKNLKYIGMCCSLYENQSSNIDIEYCEKNQITVKGIENYGDEGLVEFIISELIRLIKGLGEKQWKRNPLELKGRKIGIIGMGTTGKLLGYRLLAFGSKVFYYSRSLKPKIEKKGIKYLPLKKLLESTEIISLHLPKNTTILGESEFNHFGDGKILVNTSLGLTFNKLAFDNWIKNQNNYAIFDGDGIGKYKNEFDNLENIISSDLVSGWTKEAQERLSKKVLEKVNYFLNEKNKVQTGLQKT